MSSLKPSLPHRPPVFNAPPATAALCVALVVVHMALSVAPADIEYAAYQNFSFVPGRWYALLDGSSNHIVLAFMSLFSYAFLHGDFLHLLVNTGLLLAFGAVVEHGLGQRGFLIVFFGAVAGGALTEAWVLGPVAIPMIGASGGTYGAIGAAVPLLFRTGSKTGRRQALMFAAAIMGLNLVFGAFGLGSLIAGAEIAWQAHVGGFFAGGLLAMLLIGIADRTRER